MSTKTRESDTPLGRGAVPIAGSTIVVVMFSFWLLACSSERDGEGFVSGEESPALLDSSGQELARAGGVRLEFQAGVYSLVGEFSRDDVGPESWSMALAHARDVLRQTSPEEFRLVDGADEGEAARLLVRRFPQFGNARARTRGQRFVDRLSVIGDRFVYDRQIRYGDGGTAARHSAFVDGVFWDGGYPQIEVGDDGSAEPRAMTSDRREVFVSNCSLRDALDGGLGVIACELGRSAICREFITASSYADRAEGRIVDDAGSGEWEALVSRLIGSGAVLYNGMVSRGGLWNGSGCDLLPVEIQRRRSGLSPGSMPVELGLPRRGFCGAGGSSSE